MHSLENLRSRLPDAARDIKLNLQTVLQTTALSRAEAWGTALTSAATARSAALQAAIVAEARHELGHEAAEPVVQDALAAAALMAMNNVYYRFRHLIEKPVYADKPARLRMNRLGKPSTDKRSFELFCLAASAINGCETCMRAHERVVTSAGLSEDAVHDAIRIASTVHAAAVALELYPFEPDVAAVA